MRRFYEGLQNGQFVEIVIDPSLTAPATSQNNAMTPGNSFTQAGDRQYYVDTVLYVNSQDIESNCNQIMFYNLGTSLVTVNAVPLAQNVGWSIPGNFGEKDVTKYKAIFSGGGTQSLLVVRKNYTS